MDIYAVCFCAISALILISSLFRQKGRVIFYLLSCAIILFLICFRDQSVGSDIQQYTQAFQLFANNNLSVCLRHGWEPGFVILSKSLSLFGQTPNTYIMVMGLICLIPLFIYVYKNSRLSSVSLLVFYCFFFTVAEYLNRQWCAMLILLYSTRYIIDRKFWRFILLIILAALFHRTAVAFLPLYFLYGLKVNKRLLFSAAMVSMILGFSGPLLTGFLRQFTRMEYEFKYNGGFFMLLFLWMCVLIVYVLAKKRIQNDSYDKLYFVMLLVAAVLQPLCFTLSLWSRIVVYYSFALCFSLPIAIKSLLKVHDNRAYATIIWVIFLSLLFIYVRIFGWQSSGEHVFKLMQFGL